LLFSAISQQLNRELAESLKRIRANPFALSSSIEKLPRDNEATARSPFARFLRRPARIVAAGSAALSVR
jgi:hypothetical protein